MSLAVVNVLRQLDLSAQMQRIACPSCTALTWATMSCFLANMALQLVLSAQVQEKSHFLVDNVDVDPKLFARCVCQLTIKLFFKGTRNFVTMVRSIYVVAYSPAGKCFRAARLAKRAQEFTVLRNMEHLHIMRKKSMVRSIYLCLEKLLTIEMSGVRALEVLSLGN